MPSPVTDTWSPSVVCLPPLKPEVIPVSHTLWRDRERAIAADPTWRGRYVSVASGEGPKGPPKLHPRKSTPLDGNFTGEAPMGQLTLSYRVLPFSGRTLVGNAPQIRVLDSEQSAKAKVPPPPRPTAAHFPVSLKVHGVQTLRNRPRGCASEPTAGKRRICRHMASEGAP